MILQKRKNLVIIRRSDRDMYINAKNSLEKMGSGKLGSSQRKA